MSFLLGVSAFCGAGSRSIQGLQVEWFTAAAIWAGKVLFSLPFVGRGGTYLPASADSQPSPLLPCATGAPYSPYSPHGNNHEGS